MSDQVMFEDQAQRNEIGFGITCQIHAALEMLSNERHRHEDIQSLCDSLDALMPRIDELNSAAMSLFSDTSALKSGDLVRMVRWHSAA